MTNTTTITINVELGAPSSVLEGAVDRPVNIAIARGRGVQLVTGQVTLAPDRCNNGVLAPVGDSLDCWVSAEVLGVVGSLTGMARRRAIDALQTIGTTVITVDDTDANADAVAVPVDPRWHKVIAELARQDVSGETSDSYAKTGDADLAIAEWYRSAAQAGDSRLVEALDEMGHDVAARLYAEARS